MDAVVEEQPYLHDLVTTLRAPMLVLGGSDGQVREQGVQGVYAFDRRLLSCLHLTAGGREPVLLGTTLQGPSALVASFVVRGAGDAQPDPTVLLQRHREVLADRVVERIRVESRATRPVRLAVEVRLASDLADLESVKQGRRTAAVRPGADGDAVIWRQGRFTARAAVTPPPHDTSYDATGVTLGWQLDLAPADSAELFVEVCAQDPAPSLFGAPDRLLWEAVVVRCDDRRVEALVARSLADLQALLMQDGPDVFTAAGSPWFFTMFGRDALWTARLLLPTGTDLAMGTLRALARRQGRVHDPVSQEEPGKILHEVRRDGLDAGDLVLPPVYYGTVDATPLWVLLLVEAWRWGADLAEVRALLPACEAALDWLRAAVEADPTGFVRYQARHGTGLANQGWKDSGDSVQWADGRLAEAPIALSEVQAYAYEAAVAGADLLEAFGRPGADRLRGWAAQLGARFRAHFWVESPDGRYPAIALDRDGAAVDGIASNMGHLLGTGLLDVEESAAVAARLARPELDSGYGLRTLTAASPRFSPLSYHGGAVWPHDTAIVARGLLLDGHDELAASLLTGLLAAAAGFADRLPELYAGVQAGGSAPLPYPASCRPQAWSAAAGSCLATLPLGLRPDVPGGRLAVRPSGRRPWGELSVDGLRLGRQPLSVAVDREGNATATTAHPDVRVAVHRPR